MPEIAETEIHTTPALEVQETQELGIRLGVREAVSRTMTGKDAFKLAKRAEMKEIARQVANEIASSGTSGLSEAILQTAASSALFFAIKDFDHDGSEPFEASVQRKVKLCLESLPALTNVGEQSASNIAAESIHMGSSAHRAQKNTKHEKKKPKKESHEECFMQWVTEQGIPGETYDECILASTIHFMPVAIEYVAKEFGAVKGEERASLLKCLASTLSKVLMTYEPAYDTFIN